MGFSHNRTHLCKILGIIIFILHVSGRKSSHDLWVSQIISNLDMGVLSAKEGNKVRTAVGQPRRVQEEKGSSDVEARLWPNKTNERAVAR